MIDVINPVVEHVTGIAGSKKIGVIGTRERSKATSTRRRSTQRTRNSKSLRWPLPARSDDRRGFFNNKISRTVIGSYLDSRKLSKIDSLILACTHYPLIRPEVEDYYKGKVLIVDSAGSLPIASNPCLPKANYWHPSVSPSIILRFRFHEIVRRKHAQFLQEQDPSGEEGYLVVILAGLQCVCLENLHQ